jgi:ribonucleotide monophosphatase NagD (HAD superfamily)
MFICLQPIIPVSGKPHSVEFGLFFDIDGVITRGRTLLPHAKSAFRLLTDDRGHFLVPSIFVTNAGNTVRQSKAKQLSDWLDIQVRNLNRFCGSSHWTLNITSKIKFQNDLPACTYISNTVHVRNRFQVVVRLPLVTV